MESFWIRLALIGGGGGLGAIARYGLESAVRHLWPGPASRFPIGILVVNGLGCLAFGAIVAGAGGLDAMSSSRRLFWLTGLLGGFTTFSTFGHDTVRLMQDGRPGLALLNAGGSLVVGVGAMLAGLWLGRSSLP